MNTLGEQLSYIGPYQLVGELGRGAMAIVWLGYDPALDRHVAIKELLPPQGASTELAAEFADRFVFEARAVAKLDHPGIVTIYTAGEYDGRTVIVMELLEGETIGQMLQRGRFTTDFASDLITQLLSAAAHAHASGVIHRDIKPENIFVLPNGRLKLTDFGVAHLADSRMTQIGTVIGTPGYMSPEQVMGANTNARSDLFSIGVVAYEMLTGVNPFGRTPELPVTSIMYRISHEPIPDISQVVPGVPRHMSDTLRVLLAKSPEERPVDAEQAARMWIGAEKVKRSGFLGLGRSARPATMPPAPEPYFAPSANSAATTIERPGENASSPVPEPAPVDEAVPDPAESSAVIATAVPAVEAPIAEAAKAAEAAEVAAEGPRGGRNRFVLSVLAGVVVMALAGLLFSALGGAFGGDKPRAEKPVLKPVSSETTAAAEEATEAPAEPEPVQLVATSARVSLKKSTIVSGGKTTLTAKVTADDGMLDTGKVIVWKKASGSKNWSKMKTLSFKNNTASMSVKPTKTTYYRVEYRGSSEYEKSTSATRKLTVKHPRAVRRVIGQRTYTPIHRTTQSRPKSGP